MLVRWCYCRLGSIEVGDQLISEPVISEFEFSLYLDNENPMLFSRSEFVFFSS